MNAPIAPRAQGIQTLADVLARCVEDGDCWVWQGAKSRGVKGGTSWCAPAAWFPAMGKVMPVQRIVALLDGRHGERVWRTCGTDGCVNPAHLRAGSTKEWGRWMSDTGRTRTAAKLASGVMQGRKRSKLSDAEIEAIRTAHARCVDIGKQFGISKSYTARIRRGAARPGHPVSVWGWRP